MGRETGPRPARAVTPARPPAPGARHSGRIHSNPTGLGAGTDPAARTPRSPVLLQGEGPGLNPGLGPVGRSRPFLFGNRTTLPCNRRSADNMTKYLASSPPFEPDPLAGERRLATHVLVAAFKEGDHRFFSSPAFSFWCTVLELDPGRLRHRLLAADVPDDGRRANGRKAG
jgi:hypothetical protein